MKFIELFYQYSILLPIFISLSLSFPLPLLLKLSFINLVCYCSGVIYDVNLATSRPYAFLVIIYRRKAWQGVENGQVMECVEYFRGWLGNFFDGEYKCPVEGMQPEVTRRKHFFRADLLYPAFCVRGVRYHARPQLLPTCALCSTYITWSLLIHNSTSESQIFLPLFPPQKIFPVHPVKAGFLFYLRWIYIHLRRTNLCKIKKGK